MSNGPIWLSPEPGERKARLSRDAIARAAVEIADEEGFEAVSMRRVAARLGAGTMSLYHYIRTKDDLLALMDDRLAGEILIPEGEMPADWRGALTEIARRSRDSWVKRPWQFSLKVGGPMMGPNAMKHVDQSVGAVSDLPLSPAEKMDLIFLVDDYVSGFVLREQEAVEVQKGGWEQLDVMADFMDDHIRSGEYPNLKEYFSAVPEGELLRFWRQTMEEAFAADRFDRGLKRLLDGVALDLDRRQK